MFASSVVLFDKIMSCCSLQLPAPTLSHRRGGGGGGSSFQCSALPPTNSGTLLFPLFLEMGITEKGSHALLENHQALKLAPFDFVRTQIHALQNLGINGPLLSRLIQKRPHVLVSPEIHSLLCFLSHDLKGVIQEPQLARLLTATDPRYLSGFEPKVRLLLDAGIPINRLSHVLNNLNLTKALCLKPLQDIQKMLSFVKGFGGVDLILGRPAILNCDLDSQLVPRIEFLLDLSGGDELATTTVLLKLPFILAYSVDHYTSHVDFFRSYAGLTDEEIFKIILVYPSLFSASRTRKLQPRIEFLKQCGFSSKDIYKLLIKAPLFLSLSFEDNLAHKLVLLLKIGYEHGTKELGLAMGWVCRTSCKNMQEVISLLLNYGLTCEEILAMGKKHPQVLQYNHKSMKQKLDYLTQEMGYEVREMLAFPAFLGYGFDGRIKYRFESSGKISGEGMSINKLFSMSTARFSKKQEKQLPASS
ncbi:putative transcription regulator mTERF family [Helianthus annuus]|uniref:Putative plastid transcriptionally active 15 n=1 Tax=Helianthus annuus TaxID=4232 RepID=A0A251UH79_HELAN|nr:transcription termination factor MTERF8, chloroplastic [Helianthus annuus]KAF5800545.1 putative transcription regulator mTERF family [Helianthus annuus]KAJ0558950.1 putative transcription regulator mTERF family [Helianthus annuus]